MGISSSSRTLQFSQVLIQRFHLDKCESGKDLLAFRLFQRSAVPPLRLIEDIGVQHQSLVRSHFFFPPRRTLKSARISSSEIPLLVFPLPNDGLALAIAIACLV